MKFSEQVSHHPPALSTHTEGQGWLLYQEFTMASKFRGQYLSVSPLGITPHYFLPFIFSLSLFQVIVI